ncbi:hypothetical protein JDS40_02425 [Escherichia coli]|nr:hypothetical protein [Escherichia coli]
MKKLSLSLMLNVSLALMLALSLIYPQSVAVKIVASLFLQLVPWRRRAAALVVMVATFISLVAAGWIFTALIYLVASVFFRLIRTACRQRFEGRELCQS